MLTSLKTASAQSIYREVYAPNNPAVAASITDRSLINAVSFINQTPVSYTGSDCRIIWSIDFSIIGQSTGGLFKDVNITTDPQHSTKLK